MLCRHCWCYWWPCDIICQASDGTFKKLGCRGEYMGLLRDVFNFNRCDFRFIWQCVIFKYGIAILRLFASDTNLPNILDYLWYSFWFSVLWWNWWNVWNTNFLFFRRMFNKFSWCSRIKFKTNCTNQYEWWN